MAITYKNLQQEPLSASSTLVYTSPTVNDAVITKASAFNYGSSNVTINVNIVQNGDTIGDTNKRLSEIVPAGKSLLLADLIGAGMNTGDTLYAVADTAASVNFYVRVKEVTT